jgi:alkylated DNA repair dioxygenase AlkB
MSPAWPAGGDAAFRPACDAGVDSPPMTPRSVRPSTTEPVLRVEPTPRAEPELAAWREPLSIRRPGLALAHWPGWLSGAEAAALTEHLRRELPWEQPWVRVYGRRHPVPRLTCWIGDPGRTYRWSGLVQQPHPWTLPLQQLRRQLEQGLGQPFDSLLLNRYRDGDDRMGWHADDEPELAAGAAIASLSLGAPRSLRFRPRPGDAAVVDQPAFAVELSHGDLLRMDAPTQHHWQHALPSRRRVRGERINLTFRLFAAQPSRAIASISTRAPRGSAATATQARAGETAAPNTSA